ncbi:hypothetical protein [Marinobacter daepoensis]|uniref:hypothetical protein n=1 Tax=Marinobacter daepoensis TaxID=262077 RepID=UPI0004A416FF|nr:hypothetical protein [Marinobacter daepoensis]
MDYTDFEKSLIAIFYRLLPIKGDISVSKIDFQNGRSYLVGVGMLGDESDPIKVVFSIPRKGGESYFIICDGDGSELSREIAGLQKHNEEIARLFLHHTIPTENAYVKNAGWSGYLISLPNVAWTDFPRSANLQEREVKFWLAMPISDADRQIKIELGVDALMEKYQNEGRQLFTFNRPA